MSKKKRKQKNTNIKVNQSNSQIREAKLKYKDVYTDVTSADREIINTIKNPFFSLTILGIIALVAGIVFLSLAYLIGPVGVLRTYYEIFGYIGLAFALYEIYKGHTSKKEFNEFIHQNKFRLIWKYSEEDYKVFYSIYNKNNPGTNIVSMFVTSSLLVLLTVLLFFSMTPESRFIAIPFGVISIIIVFIISYFLPQNDLKRTKEKPYIVLLDDHRAYALGQFFTWDTSEAKLVKTKSPGNQEIIVLRMEIEDKDFLSKKVVELPLLLPNNDEETIILARNEAKRINRLSTEYKNDPANQGDILDRFFRKVVGRN